MVESEREMEEVTLMRSMIDLMSYPNVPEHASRLHWRGKRILENAIASIGLRRGAQRAHETEIPWFDLDDKHLKWLQEN